MPNLQKLCRQTINEHTMRRKPTIILMHAVLALTLAACKSDRFELGVPFTLKEGGIATAKEDKTLEISMVEVMEDSRCPVNVNCIWEGEATVRFTLAQGSQPPEEMTLTLRGGYRDLAVGRFSGYSISLLRLDPYPVADAKTEKGAYTAQLVVKAGSEP